MSFREFRGTLSSQVALLCFALLRIAFSQRLAEMVPIGSLFGHTGAARTAFLHCETLWTGSMTGNQGVKGSRHSSPPFGGKGMPTLPPRKLRSQTWPHLPPILGAGNRSISSFSEPKIGRGLNNHSNPRMFDVF